MILPTTMTAALLAAVSVGPGSDTVRCQYATGQTATLTAKSVGRNLLTLVGRHGSGDISLIRLDQRGNIEGIETNGGVTKYKEVTQVWRILHRRLGEHPERACGIGWRFSPE